MTRHVSQTSHDLARGRQSEVRFSKNDTSQYNTKEYVHNTVQHNRILGPVFQKCAGL